MSERRQAPRDFPSIRRVTAWQALLWTLLVSGLVGGVLWVVLGWWWTIEWRVC